MSCKMFSSASLVAMLPLTAAWAADVHMPLGGRTLPPVGYIEFCQRSPAECGPAKSPEAEYRPTPFQWSHIQRLNAEVNGAFTRASDDTVYGKDEMWAYPDKAGDTEDFALVKKKRLKEYGVPYAALLLTVALKRNGDGHALLTIVTDKGDFVLDDESDEIRIWHEAPYQLLKRQSPSTPLNWVRVNDPD